MLLLADIAPYVEDPRLQEHSNVLLGWGLVLAAWFFFTGIGSVAGAGTALRNALDDVTPLTRRLGLAAGLTNAVLAVWSVALVFLLRNQPHFASFSVDLRTIAALVSAVQAAVAIVNLVILRARPVVVPPDEASDQAG